MKKQDFTIKEERYISSINWLRGAICNLIQGYPDVAKASLDKAIKEFKLAGGNK